MRSVYPLIPRVERHHALLEALCMAGSRPQTAASLASQLRVSPRTVERDIAHFVDLGLPIRSARGPSGGYILALDSSEFVLVLSPAEVGALIATLVAVGPQASASAQSVFMKLHAVLTGNPPG